MITRSTAEQHAHSSQWKGRMLHRTYQMLLPEVAKDSNNAPTPSSNREELFVTQGFILGILSIFCSFFPVCGFPIAISGLMIGLSDLADGHKHKMTRATIALSTIGLIMTLINIIISIGIYFSFYMWQ